MKRRNGTTLSLCTLGLLAVAICQCVPRAQAPRSNASGGPEELTKGQFVTLAGKDSLGLTPVDSIRRSRTPVVLPGDELTIQIYEKLPVSQDKRIEMKRVKDDGTIFILPIGELNVSGRTQQQIENDIESRMAQFIVSPYCEVVISQRAYEPRIYVFGEVIKPGSIPLKQGDRLLDALSEAGGCSENAYRRSLKIVRIGNSAVEMTSVNLGDVLRRGDVRQNVFLQDQDVVFVPRRFYTGFREVTTVLGTLLPWYYFAANFGL